MKVLFLVLILSLVGCATSPPSQESADPEATVTPTPAPIATEENEDSKPESEGPVTLRIWVPPQFDPAADSLASAIFQARLDEFISRKPNVEIEVRIKNVEGYGGIMDTLTTADAAAPLALPDLVALPRHALETAATVGVLYPYDGLTSVLDDPDWYEYARQLSHWQNVTVGIPFAGDALIMTYRPEVVQDPPLDWGTSLALTKTLTFPAADLSAMYTLAQYQSLGVPLTDENEQPVLDVIQLTMVLSYYQQASTVELMPYWLTQYESDDQSWEGYEDGQADMAITWMSRYFQSSPADTAASPIPTNNAVPFTLANGWSWGLTTNDPDRQLLTAQLAEFLTTSEYLASWTAALGLIPPRPSATEAWGDQPSKNLINQVAPSAQLMPSLNLVTVMGPILQQATVSVLKAEADSTVAAEIAVGKLVDPP